MFQSLGLVYAKSISFRQRGEIQEARSHRVELVEPREDAPTALESSEQPLNLVPKLAGFPVAALLAFGGTTGVIPISSTRRRISSPSQSRSIARGAFAADYSTNAVVARIESASFRLRKHADFIPEHVRTNASIVSPFRRKRGRPKGETRTDDSAGSSQKRKTSVFRL